MCVCSFLFVLWPTFSYAQRTHRVSIDFMAACCNSILFLWYSCCCCCCFVRRFGWIFDLFHLSFTSFSIWTISLVTMHFITFLLININFLQIIMKIHKKPQFVPLFPFPFDGSYTNHRASVYMKSQFPTGINFIYEINNIDCHHLFIDLMRFSIFCSCFFLFFSSFICFDGHCVICHFNLQTSF